MRYPLRYYISIQDTNATAMCNGIRNTHSFSTEYFRGTDAVCAHPNRQATRSELMKFDSFIALTLYNNNNNALSNKSHVKPEVGNW